MAKITVEDIRKLAKLARLKLTDEELDRYHKELEQILSYVEQLNNVDTGDLEPTSQVTGLTNVTRPDEIIDYQVSRDDLLNNAPEQHKGYIKVKRVL